MKAALNVIGPQVRSLRLRKGWTQPVLAEKLQLLGWSISTGSLGKLEAQLRHAPDLEVAYFAKALGVTALELLPRVIAWKTAGAQFQSGRRRAIFPTRGER
jgi:transcriptional regulator with XRE-family HTH domain